LGEGKIREKRKRESEGGKEEISRENATKERQDINSG